MFGSLALTDSTGHNDERKCSQLLQAQDVDELGGVPWVPSCPV